MTPDEKRDARRVLWEKGDLLMLDLQGYVLELVSENRACIQNEIEEEEGQPTFEMQVYGQGLRTSMILSQIGAALTQADKYRQDCWSLATGLPYQDLAKDFKFGHGINLPGYEEAREPDWTPPPLCELRGWHEFDPHHCCIHCGAES